jgi:hypothetical protein
VERSTITIFITFHSQNSAEIVDNLESKIENLSSFLGTLRGDYFRHAKTAAKKERRDRRIDPQHGASEHCISWEDGRRNFEPPPTTESDESFLWPGHAPISSKLAHFLLKRSKLIHNLKK